MRMCEKSGYADEWQLNLNINKCIMVSCGRQIDNSYKYYLRNDDGD